jgi:hypothetical protein
MSDQSIKIAIIVAMIGCVAGVGLMMYGLNLLFNFLQ